MDKLIIFVSGTIEDMKSERKAVSDAIHSLHLDAVDVEIDPRCIGCTGRWKKK